MWQVDHLIGLKRPVPRPLEARCRHRPRVLKPEDKEDMKRELHITDEAEAFLPTMDSKGKPITVIGNEAIRATFDAATLQQALNSRSAPGVTEVVLNPDAHLGYGAPIGCVMVSPTHIYPGPVGVDIKCSMSLLQMDLPEDAVDDKRTRRELINAITDRTPTGAGHGQRSVKKRAAYLGSAWRTSLRRRGKKTLLF